MSGIHNGSFAIATDNVIWVSTCAQAILHRLLPYHLALYLILSSTGIIYAFPMLCSS
ncbi:hypothetical protein CC77DRAFT_743863 [Alternaria alternata]|uniref:Uncharacterized protein n=1 Tax=Alternaria alternata TaxID=5599 RepID=A0A177DU40_ALTAL|nr:hypothetical protein CC77DRAFT_743863 [Alternaria alternata]OAG22681.1 hypothetical protein CC77DRAFT_743863 [Alternaria alternata]